MADASRLSSAHVVAPGFDDPVACPGSHTQRYELRHDELGPDGYYPGSALLGVLQEAAIDGSAARGFPLRYYHREQAFWMLRRATFRYLRPLRHGEEFTVTTWVSRVGKTSPTREYRIDSVTHGDCVARVRSYWVYIDQTTGRSKDIPDDLRAAFAPTDEPLPRVLSVPDGPLLQREGSIVEQRQVQHSDVDWTGHAKCCSYLKWLEDLFGRCCREASAEPGATGFADFDLQLVSATKPADVVQLLAQPGDPWKVDLATDAGTDAGQVVARAVLWPRQVDPERTGFEPTPASLRERLQAIAADAPASTSSSPSPESNPTAS